MKIVDKVKKKLHLDDKPILWFAFKLSTLLVIGYFMSLFGRKHYMEKLDKGLNCFCKTDSVFIDKTNYLDQIGFTFTIHTGEQIRYLSPIDVNLKRFNYSRIYTVRYLCDEYKYNELILEDWDENKYVKNEKNQYLLK